MPVLNLTAALFGVLTEQECPHLTRESTEQTVFSEQEKHSKKTEQKKFINH